MSSRVEQWRQAYKDGTAGAVCDLVVHSRPTPAALVEASELGRPLRDHDPRTTPLTGREREVLRACSEGLQQKQIAARHGVSMNTVNTQLRRIRAKLGASSTRHAVALGYEAGLLP